jgi:hypothetical protein
MGRLGDAALDYAAAGYHVFPLQPQGKTPLTAHGLDDATTDEATIETWWSRWPDANVAIRTGDVVVVDEDRSGAFEELALSIGETIPQTSVVTTASGRHFYFRQPEGQHVRNTAGRLGPGIDTRGEGGYVVAPPSLHPTGVTYAWAGIVEAIPQLPGWLLELLEKKQPERQPLPPDLQLQGTTPYGKRALEAELHAVATAVEGTRNDTLNTASFALGQLVAGGEVDAHDAQTSLDAAARACGLPMMESRKTIQSGFSAGMEEPRSAPDNGAYQASSTNGTAALKLVPEPTGDPLTETQPERDSWLPLNLNDLPEKPPVQPDLGGTHLIYPGKRHVFSGAPESGKTLSAYCILIQTARCGGLGILIDFEMGAFDSRKRLRELGASAPEIDRILFVEPDAQASSAKVERLADFGPELVVIDATAGVYSLEGLDDNKRLDVEKIGNIYIRPFWRKGIATILIDHVVKNDESRGRYAIGSERKLGGADVHLGFDTVKEISRGTTGKYKITTHKDRGGFLKRGYLADVKLSSDPETHNITWSFTEPVVSTDDKGHFRYTKLMQKISNELAGVTETLSKAEVKRRVGGKSDQLGKAIDSLIAEQYMTASDGERGAVNVLLTRPYSEADDPLLNASSAPVPVLFSSCSETGDRMTCSPVPYPLGGEQEEQPSATAENQGKIDDLFPGTAQGWFNEEGRLDERPDDGYLDSIDPGPEDLEWR